MAHHQLQIWVAQILGKLSSLFSFSVCGCNSKSQWWLPLKVFPSLGYEWRFYYSYSYLSSLTHQLSNSFLTLAFIVAHSLLLNESKTDLNSEDPEIFPSHVCLFFDKFNLYPFASYSMFTPRLLNKGNTPTPPLVHMSGGEISKYLAPFQNHQSRWWSFQRECQSSLGHVGLC